MKLCSFIINLLITPTNIKRITPYNLYKYIKFILLSYLYIYRFILSNHVYIYLYVYSNTTTPCTLYAQHMLIYYYFLHIHTHPLHTHTHIYIYIYIKDGKGAGSRRGGPIPTSPYLFITIPNLVPFKKLNGMR